MTGGSAAMPPVALRIDDVSKEFPGTVALDGASFVVRPGSIHALLGENGSGKSTLIKALAGVQVADAGWIEIHGQRLPASDVSPAQARDAGLRFVHQQPSTFAELSVAENLALGAGFITGAGKRIMRRELRDRCRGVLDRFNIRADPDEELGSLNPAARTMVAIARALQHDVQPERALLVLDEPTATLPAEEALLLMDALRSYASQGQTILYVTHRLDEVLALADAVTVLRDGIVVADEEADRLSRSRLVELIVGKAIDRVYPERPPTARVGSLLKVRGLCVGQLEDVNISFRSGEILGLAGLVGSGRSTLLRALYGLQPPTAGTIVVNGRESLAKSPMQAVAAGIGYVCEDRSRAIFPELSLCDNLSLGALSEYWRGGVLRGGAERRGARELIERYRIRTESELKPMSTLSGGNQQKAVLARCLRKDPRLLLLDEPTQGVDIGARHEIYSLIRGAADRGMAVLVASSDFEELAGLCDRVLVIRGGRVEGEATAPDIDSHALHTMAYGTEAIV